MCVQLSINRILTEEANSGVTQLEWPEDVRKWGGGGCPIARVNLSYFQEFGFKMSSIQFLEYG